MEEGVQREEKCERDGRSAGEGICGGTWREWEGRAEWRGGERDVRYEECIWCVVEGVCWWQNGWG